MRLIITGWPASGKSAYAASMEVQGLLHHTDIFSAYPWKKQADLVAKLLDGPGPWVIEGVTALRGLRRWRDMHPDHPPPCERVLFFRRKFGAHSPGQAAMARGQDTILCNVSEWLGRRLKIVDSPRFPP